MSTITLQFDTAADLESALLDALQNNEGHVSGIAAYLAQTGAEAVAPEAKPEWPNGAFFTDGDGSFYDEQAEPLPGKESRHMDDSELYCPQCNGSGEGRERTTGHGPDDYEYDCPCQLCGGNGSLFRAFEGMKAERDALRQKYNAALARFPVPSLLPAEVEQRTYKDGTQATGTAPLPDKSPAEQERAALSAQAAPEYRTGFDEAPSTFNQEDAAPADYPPQSEIEAIAERLGATDPDDSLWRDFAHAAIDADRAQRSGVSADPLPLDQSQVEWVVNDIAELGVKIGQQFFWLYKGDSLVYGKQPDEQAQGVVLNHDTDPPKVMHWRPVFKREFGECCHPVNYADLRVCGHPHRIGTVSLDDSDEWKPIPAPPQHQVKKGEPS